MYNVMYHIVINNIKSFSAVLVFLWRLKLAQK